MRVILADDSVLFREGVARVLADAGFEVTGKVGDAERLLAWVRADPPDVVVVDIRMPPTHTTEGLVAARRLRDEHPGVGVLVLSQFVETHYAMALVEERAGGVGYLLKDRVADIEEFAAAVRRVGHGKSVVDSSVVALLMGRRRTRGPLDDLTEREREVLSLIAEGLSNRSICSRLVLTPKTVETHVRNIFMKLDLPPGSEGDRRVLAVLAYLRSLS